MSDKILSPKFRGSYVNVFRPRQINGEGEPKFSTTIVLPKNLATTKQFLASLRAEFKKAMIEKFGKEFPENTLKHFPIRDGDEAVDNDGEARDEFKGCWTISCKNTRQPGLTVLDSGTRRPPEGENEFYSGAYYYASVTVYAWKHATGGRGVSISLSGLCKVADGERFGGGSFSESDFDSVPVDDDAPPPAKPGKGKPPVDDDV